MKKPKLGLVSIFILTVLGLFSLSTPGVFAAGEIAVDNSNIAWSPYGWVTNGSVYKQSPTVGSYINVAFTGTTLGLNIDTSMVSAPAVPANFTVSAYIDGGAPITLSLADVSANQLIFTSSLSSGSHYAHIAVDSNTNFSSRWSYSGGEPISLLRVTSIQLESSGTIQNLATTPLAQTGPKILYYGDSITEGNGISGTYGSQSHASVVGNALDAQYGIHGYSSLTWWFSILSNTPDFHFPVADAVNFPTAAWNNYYKNVSLLNTANLSSSGYREESPDAVFNNLGINDIAIYGLGAPFGGATALNNYTANLYDWLEQQRSALGARPAIFMVVPFNYSCTSAINPIYNLTQEGYLQLYKTTYLNTINSYKADNNDNRVFIIDLGTNGCQTVVDNSPDGLHPNETGAQILGEEIASLAEPNIILNTPLTASINGHNVADGMTVSGQAIISGTAPGGSTVSISAQPGNYTCTTTVAVNGTWSCTLSSLTNATTYSLEISTQTTYGQTLQLGVISIIYMLASSINSEASTTILAQTGIGRLHVIGPTLFLLLGCVSTLLYVLNKKHRT